MKITQQEQQAIADALKLLSDITRQQKPPTEAQKAEAEKVLVELGGIYPWDIKAQLEA